MVAETIKEHREMIQRHGYVWWGWWNKPDERIPRKTFEEFTQTISGKEELSIYLVDSGHRRLYKTKLREIRMSPTEDLIDCPEKEKSPAYYSATKYKVWFKLGPIQDVPNSEIKQWTYDEVKEFLDDPYESRFQDKRVYSIEEMLDRRHRTIYFVKPYHENHHMDYPLQLVPSTGSGFMKVSDIGTRLALPTELRDFMTTPLYRDSTYVIHLSDLHFSNAHHGFPLKASRSDRPLANLLDQDIKELGYETSPAAVVISGDFTWQGRKDEFELAREFMVTLQSLANLEPQHMVIVPGNHDIGWSQQTGDDYDREKLVIQPSRDAEANYREFFAQILQFSPNDYLSMGRRYILGNFGSLDIIGLNSCRLEQKQFAGYGFIGLPQIDSAADDMNWAGRRHRTRHRMIMFHHHLIPVTAKEKVSTYDVKYSLTLDSGQIAYRALELGVDLVAHGHMHQPFASSLSRTSRTADFPPARSLGIHGAGSAGATREYLGAIGKNSYSIYEFNDSEITVRVRAMSENLEGFEDEWKFRFHTNPEGGLELGHPKH